MPTAAKAHLQQFQPNDDFTMGNSLVTLFAVWKENPELTYNANGGVFSTYVKASYPAVGKAVILTSFVPQKEGYVFCGWAESETASVDEIVTSPYTMPDKDVVLYAVYEPINYEVSVYASAGYSVSGIDPDGYTLGEYAEFTVTGENPKVYINGIPVLPINGIYKFEINNDSSVIISDASAVSVIYSANGGVNAPIDMGIYVNGDTTVIKSDAPVRTGYIFKGWSNTSDSDYGEYIGGENVSVGTEDIVLYAVWEPITYTILYSSKGGNGEMHPTTAVYNEELSLCENTFTKDGFQFAGWSYSEDGEIAYIDGAVIKNLSDTQNAEITLYAVWKGAKTTVLFSFEGGSSGTTSCEVEYGEILPTDKLVAPSRYGYLFAGYYTAANKTGNLVYNEDMSLSDYYKTNPWDSVSAEFY